MKYRIERTNKFTKQYAKMLETKSFQRRRIYQGSKNLDELRSIAPAKYHNHLLEPKSSRYMGCHVQPDVLLEYEKHDKELILLLVTIGSHSNLFK